ncbi:MAG: GNAT family N-acetyltransferase [Pyrinomonadaceae bacterium]
MRRQNLKLIAPTAGLKAEFLAMAQESVSAGDEHYKSELEDFDAHLNNVENYALGTNLPPNHVPSDTFWLVRERRIIGRSDLRHRLNANLEDVGGHIGYDIRPTERRKGYGTLILKLTLEKAKNRGLKRVLLTCAADNTGSAKIIEKNGGKLSEQEISKTTGKMISRYWIEIL